MSVSLLFTILYWAWIASEILLQVLTPTTRSQGKLRDRGSLILLLAAIFGAIWAAGEYAGRHPHTMFGGATWLETLALVLMAIGLGIRWTAVITLGRSFSTNVAIHATQSLRTTGLYRWVRHPSYSGMLVLFAAVGIYERNWISFAILLIVPTAGLLYRIHVEEQALTEAFGPEYAQYSKRVKRLIPMIY